jgi:hypothetical protein
MVVFNIFMIKINAVMEAAVVNVGNSVNWKPRNYEKINQGAGQFFGDHTKSPVTAEVNDPDLIDTPVSALSKI